MSSPQAFAEIIESSLQKWLAQSWEWNALPAFGSLVSITTPTRTLIAVVHQISTGSMDPSRYPFAYKKSHEELLQEQPQIFEFLKTTFECLPLGYCEKGKIHYMLSPEPPLIHAFVSPASADLCKQFFYQDTYLHVLFGLSATVFNLDELLLAMIKQQSELGILNAQKLTNFTHSFSLLTGNDYRRLKLFLQRAQSTISL